jgi:hypothetical protein
MDTKIYLFCSTDEIDKNLKKLINFFGLNCEFVNEIKNIEQDSCLFLNCDIWQKRKLLASDRDLLISKCSYIFLYNLSPGYSRTIEWLTEFKINVSRINDEVFYYRVSDDDPEVCKHLGGAAFSASKPNKDYIFQSTNSSVRSLISINNEPYFIRFEIENCEIFALSNKKMVDLDQKVTSGDFKISSIFSEFAPILMFLKYCLKNQFMHSSGDYACFIIDDPLLKSNYGFLNFKKLLSKMKQHNFCSNISFIPYNWNRSDNEILRMFNERDDKFSITIHGCDHCQAEFGITDEKELNRKIKLALSRMNKHQKINVIEYNKVMVFPQGSFSSNSLKILKANNFLGAINSKILADDAPHLYLSRR